MRAVIVATGESPDGALLNDRLPVPMRPLVDRPFIQHVVESCVRQGIQVFDWLLCHLPEEIEEFLGSGQRWGAQFRYHLVRDAFRPYERLRVLTLGEVREEPVLLGHADRLPGFRLAEVEASALSAPVLYGWHEGGDQGRKSWQWSGWAVLPAGIVRGLPGRDVDEKGLGEHLCTARGANPHWVEVSRPLSVHSFPEVLAANRSVLGGDFPELLQSGKAVAPGIRLARGVVLHPSARLVPPVFIGEDCEVGAGAQVGPNVVVGRGCVLDRRSTVRNAVILPGTYVGDGLELDGVLVDQNRVAPGLQGPRWGVEPECLASLCGGGLRRAVGRAFSMGLGLALLLLASPVLLLMACVLKLVRGDRPVLYCRRPVRLPAGPDERSWSTHALWSFVPAGEQDPGRSPVAWGTHFFLHFLPALVNVARGELRLVGLPPRTPEEIRRLGPDWRALYLEGEAGIVSETLLAPEPLSEEEVYATEAVYAATGGAVHNLGLLLRYLLRVLGSLWTAPRTEHALPLSPALGGSVATNGTATGVPAGGHAAQPLHGPHALSGPRRLANGLPSAASADGQAPAAEGIEGRAESPRKGKKNRGRGGRRVARS
jgi:hypothetical protein